MIRVDPRSSVVSFPATHQKPGRELRRNGPMTRPAAAKRLSTSRASSNAMKKRAARNRPAGKRLRRTAGERDRSA